MKTTDAMKFCFTKDEYRAIKGQAARTEILKMACLVAFRQGYNEWVHTSPHYQAAAQLKKALTILEETGKFEE